jgi:hypothetical protein
MPDNLSTYSLLKFFVRPCLEIFLSPSVLVYVTPCLPTPLGGRVPYLGCGMVIYGTHRGRGSFGA